MNKEYTGLEVAVIGIGVCFPGAHNHEEYWRNLIDNIESISFFNNEELENEGIKKEEFCNERYVPAKGILDEMHFFDYEFFNYSKKEASIMDPQMRIMHQCAWHALEDSGYNPWKYKKKIGIYAGAASNLYWFANTMSIPENQMLGFSLADQEYLCSRVAHKLNLRGPAVYVQTACSTSLVAIHTASRALLMGECDMALAGGMSIILPQKRGYYYVEGAISSSDGHCRTFDDKATGTVLSDGGGFVLLKPLKNAIADNDRIYGVIKGSAVNNDGNFKVGYAAPNVDGQIDVLKKALSISKVDPSTISYIETHGTGTKLGDPIEFESISKIYSKRETPCYLGAVKSNIGHLGQGAGIAGFVKTLLALYNNKIPGTLHFEKMNNEIVQDKKDVFVINTDTIEWPSYLRIKRAAVSSFGIGGTNAHIIVEEYIDDGNIDVSFSKQLSYVPISGKSMDSLANNIKTLLDYINGNQISLCDLSYTLNRRKQFFDFQFNLIVEDLFQVKKKSLAFLENKKINIEDYKKKNSGNIVFMFPGQGSQYANMAKGLYDNVNSFKQLVDYGVLIYKQLTGIDLLKILFEVDEKSDLINETHVTQPILFIIEYALAKTLITIGIKPVGMIGHSIGEYVAACISEVYSYEDAIRIIQCRGRLMNDTISGKMIAVGIDNNKITALLNNRLELAVINTDRNCVIAGGNKEIDEVKVSLDNQKIANKILPVSNAFHSYLMEPILNDFMIFMSSIKLNSPKIPFISNLTGTWIKEEEAICPNYWANHLRSTVQFKKGTIELSNIKKLIAVEVGPSSGLTSMLRYNLKENKNGIYASVNLLPNSQQRESDLFFFYRALNDFIGFNYDIDIDSFIQKGRIIDVPKYCFKKTILPINLLNQQLPIEIGCKELDTMHSEEENRYEESLDYIQQIFKNTLGIDNISASDDFFELGGDSLAAISIISSIYEKYKVKISISDIFHNTTPSEIYKLIVHQKQTDPLQLKHTLEKSYYRLSFAQQRLYIESQVYLNKLTYNEPFVIALEGTLNLKRLKYAFSEQIRRHEIFRTTFHIIDDILVQKVHNDYDMEIEFIYANEDESIENLMKQIIRPFKLDVLPLLRVGLIQINEEKRYLVIDIHHIITDGTSMNYFLKDLMKIYWGETIDEVDFQYKDFAEWQQSDSFLSHINMQSEYWKKKLLDFSSLNLPLDFVRGDGRASIGCSYFSIIKNDITEQLYSTVKKEGVTLFMYLIGVFYILLYQITNQKDILIGTAVSGRNHIGLEKIMGMFVNMIVLRKKIQPEMCFKDFLRNLKIDILNDFENQDYPYENLVDLLECKRENNRNNIFDVAFVLQNMPNNPSQDTKIQTSLKNNNQLNFIPIEIKSEYAKFDLLLTVYESNGELKLKFDYSPELFLESTIINISNIYLDILGKVLINPTVDIDKLLDHKVNSVDNWINNL